MKILTLDEHFKLLSIEQRIRAKRMILEREMRAAAGRQQLKEIKESNAEYQRNKLLTKEEIGRRAIDRMTQNLIKYNSNFKGEAQSTEAEARAKAQQLQEKIARERGEG